MLRIALIRPGSTMFDEERRIKGSLDIPLSDTGNLQVEQTCQELSNFKFDCIYSAPCESAVTTAKHLGRAGRSKVKIVEELRNLDHGLWQGKLIDEVRRQQPTVYRKFQEDPTSICPPGGETIEAARERVRHVVQRWLKKHEDEFLGAVVPEPFASIFRNWVLADNLGDLWEQECDHGNWEIVQIESVDVLV